jgi:formylglycine-generating enzyme required for sulfatase activity
LARRVELRDDPMSASLLGGLRPSALLLALLAGGVGAQQRPAPDGAAPRNVRNVWEWTADWFRPYAERDRPFTPDPASERAQRGGSFLCDSTFCHGFRVSARSHASPETALFHVGFRLVQDLPAP